MKRAPPYSRAKFFAKKRRSRIYFPTSGRANIWTESHEVYVAMTDASSPVVEKITGHMVSGRMLEMWDAGGGHQVKAWTNWRSGSQHVSRAADVRRAEARRVRQ